jgi:hypothetical protein
MEAARLLSSQPPGGGAAVVGSGAQGSGADPLPMTKHHFGFETMELRGIEEPPQSACVTSHREA